MLQRILIFLLAIGIVAVCCPGIRQARTAPTDEMSDLPARTGAIEDAESALEVPDYVWVDFAGPEGVGALALPADDPCLPSGFANWRERWLEHIAAGGKSDFVGARVIIDRAACMLTLQGVRADQSSEDTYSTPVAIGDLETPTPVGQFLINHVYCYSDVLFFGESQQQLAGLYNGFFAPLLVCDDTGQCQRYRELGIHGFNAAAYPDPQALNPETQGPVSHGCIRLPDPCAFKNSLIRTVGVGPLRRNERGSYHWLTRPVEVWVVDDETTLLALIKEGFFQMHQGLNSIFNWILE